MRAQADSVPQLRMPAVRWAVGVLLLILVLGVGTALFALYLMFAPVKLPAPLEGSKAATTQILAADGSVIEQWHGPINRTFVELDDMSEHLRHAAIAAEDARFYKRGAVDLRAVLRATRENLLDGSFVQGGSTIGQQHAKNVYVGNARSLSRKVREARVAYRLERDLGKDKVLEGYLNTVYFGRGAYGVEAASKVYFGKAASELTVSEASLLISLIRSPNAYSPYRHPAKSEARRGWVLDRMKKLDFLTPQQAREAVQQKPALTPASEAHPRYGWYMDALRTYLLRRYGAEKVYSGGLKVQTTLDPQAQEAAETTLATALPDEGDPYAALVSIDPATGYVRAIVGGRDYSDEKYNIAIQGRRQPGSAFKPLVLVAALEKGIQPSAGYRAPGRICLKGWKPSCVSNYGGSGYGYLSLERATINSVNTVYAQLILDVGPQNVVDVARRMGIPGPEWTPPRSACRPTADDACRTLLQPLPAMALGTEEVTPLELASAYATLAAGGVYREPKLVSRVEDAGGHVLEEGPSEPRQAISPEVAETVTGILSKVITSGTGTRAGFGRPAAGKTGTAQDYGNAWFSGYTPQLATALWVGHRNGNRPLLNVQGVRRVAGGTLPAAMWREYMKGVSDRTPPTLELGAAVTNGAFIRDRQVNLTGGAADEDGLVQGIELSVDGGPFSSAGVVCAKCPGQEVTWKYRSPNSLGDGEHVIAVRSFDKPGHRSEPQTRTFTVDTRPPVLTKLSATGGATGVEVMLNEPVACSSVSARAFAVTVDGKGSTVRSAGCRGPAGAAIELELARRVRGGDQVTVDIRGSSRAPTDPAGNRAGRGPVRVSAANKAPVAELNRSDDPGPFTATDFEMTGAATDPDGTVKAVEVSVDGAAFSSAGVGCSGCGKGSEVTWRYEPRPALSNGKHTLAFRSVDNAGTSSRPLSRSVAVDSVAPSVQRIRSTGGRPVVEVTFSEPVACGATPAAQFRATAGGRRAGVLAAACEGSNAKLTLSRAPDGGERVKLMARGPSRSRQAVTDVAGNPVAAFTRSVTATNQRPVLRISTPGADLTTSSFHTAGESIMIEGTASDPDGIVEEVEASIDHGGFTRRAVKCRGCGRSREVTFSVEVRQVATPGLRSVSVRARDSASAFSGSIDSRLTNDDTEPVLRDVSAGPGNSTVTAAFSERLDCSSVEGVDFAVRVKRERRPVLSVGCSGESQKEVTLRISGRMKAGDPVSVEINGTVQDLAGNLVAPGSRQGMTVPKYTKSRR